MKRTVSAIVVAGVLFSLIAIDLPWNMGAGRAGACNWGEGGGQGFVPQRRDDDRAYASASALTKEQARSIIEQHVTRLNNTLKVGPVRDAGELYEAEIFSKANEIVQIIGVDKRSGRLVLVN